jgi:acyl-CoA thioesterase
MANRSRREIINQYIQRDPFAKHLGATVEIIAPGHSRVSLTVTAEMVNFHGMTHGGLIFTLGDIAFAAASNSRGQTAVALNVGISFLSASKAGDRLVAEAKEQQAGGPTALYDITVKDQNTGDLIAKSQNMVYRKRQWFVPQDPDPDAPS